LSKRSNIPFFLRPLFLVVVVLPTLLAVYYYGWVASDVYVTESRFVIRSPQKSGAGSLADVFSKVGFTQSDGDSFVVRDYVLSRDALDVLNSKLNVIDRYSRPSIDIVNRFPGLKFWDTSREAFLRYYQTRVGVLVDPASSISVLTVQAFDPETSLIMNQTLLELSEAFVNQLNTRARQDLISSAVREVNLAKERLENSALELAKVRTQTLKPGEAEKQLILVQRLTLEKDFAGQQLAASMAALEQARVEAIRKQVYLERISKPVLPDAAVLPDRLRGMLTYLILGLLAWGIMSLMLAGAREHHG
jgi:capsular polysaccharide transport system permease protein